MKTVTPVLYVKTGCPWCDDVIDYFRSRKMPFEQITVTGNPQAMEEMRELSGQTKAPTMDWNGDVLADFGVEELIPFLKKHGVE